MQWQAITLGEVCWSCETHISFLINLESKECELTLYTDKILSLQDLIYLCSSEGLVADTEGGVW